MKLLHLVVGLFCVIRPVHYVYANGSEYPALLGNGFDTDKLEHKTSQCVEGVTVPLNNREYKADFTKVESWSQLQASMNFEVPGSIILNSESELARFTLRARDTQFTSTYILHNHVMSRQSLLKNPKLVSDEKDPRLFREECGNEFISLISHGGKLHVGIKFSFSDHEFKQEFDTGGALTSITGLGAHVSALSSDARTNSSVEIFFHQVGGDLSELHGMFDSKDIVSCSLEHFDKCENLIAAVWNYSKDRFAKSVLEGKDQTIAYQTEEYRNHPKATQVESVNEERHFLLDELDTQQYDRDLLQSLKGERLKLYENCDDRCLTRLIATVMTNIRLLREAIRLSFEDPALFKSTKTLDKLALKKIELPVLKPVVKPAETNFLLRNMHYVVPATAISVLAVVVPFMIKYFCYTAKNPGGAST